MNGRSYVIIIQRHNFQSLIFFIDNLHEVYTMFNAQSEAHKHLALA